MEFPERTVDDIYEMILLDSPMPSFLPPDLIERIERKQAKSVVTVDTSLLRDTSEVPDVQFSQVFQTDPEQSGVADSFPVSGQMEDRSNTDDDFYPRMD